MTVEGTTTVLVAVVFAGWAALGSAASGQADWHAALSRQEAPAPSAVQLAEPIDSLAGAPEQVPAGGRR